MTSEINSIWVKLALILALVFPCSNCGWFSKKKRDKPPEVMAEEGIKQLRKKKYKTRPKPLKGFGTGILSRANDQVDLHRQAMKGLLPDIILKRSSKADFMSTFRRQLDNLNTELLRDIVPPRAEWVQPAKAFMMCTGYHDEKYAGWAEWWLWTLVGCDALTNVPKTSQDPIGDPLLKPIHLQEFLNEH